MCAKQAMREIEKVKRPREKMMERGAESLFDAELLAVILGSGIPGRNVKKVAESILARFGEDLPEVGMEDLVKVPGIGKVKATQIVAAFELAKRFLLKKEVKVVIDSSEDVMLLCENMIKAKQERLVALFLDSRRQLIEKREIARGTVDANLVHPREVLGPAVELRASVVILVHNHPSGDPTPSPQDLEVTERMKKAGAIMGIALLDHLVIGREGVKSAM